MSEIIPFEREQRRAFLTRKVEEAEARMIEAKAVLERMRFVCDCGGQTFHLYRVKEGPRLTCASCDADIPKEVAR